MQQSQKSKPGFLLLLLLWPLRKAWQDFPNNSSEKSLNFHKAAESRCVSYIVTDSRLHPSRPLFLYTSQLTISTCYPGAYDGRNKSKSLFFLILFQ